MASLGVTGFGAALGFVADSLSIRWLGQVAFAVAGIGLLIYAFYIVMAFVNAPGAIVEQFTGGDPATKDGENDDKGWGSDVY